MPTSIQIIAEKKGVVNFYLQFCRRPNAEAQLDKAKKDFDRAEFTPKNVQTQEERVKLVFGLKVSVKNVNDELKPSMPADVRILL